MRISLRSRNPGEIEFGIIFGSMAVMALIAARFLPLTDMAPSCVFKTFTGFPCPTCGTTRSLVRLANGDLTGSLLMNPAVALGMIAAILWLLSNTIIVLLDTSRFTLSFTRSESNMVRVAALTLLLLNWWHLVLSQ
ncbi:MAG: DUF2752 domain-containing protein [Nitrospirota bacterium]